mmetsp:Transcript_45260/g.105001  ORF Transcript_45260/g.105001 Transcript_45260/m.105001 type:complete len:317 (+) Transcript_45260:82-1032(+)
MPYPDPFRPTQVGASTDGIAPVSFADFPGHLTLLQPQNRGFCLVLAALDHAVALVAVWIAVFNQACLNSVLPWSLGFGVASSALRIFEVRRSPAVALPRILVEPTMVFHMCQMFAFSILGGFFGAIPNLSSDGIAMRLMAIAFLAMTVMDGMIVCAARRRKRRVFELQLKDMELDIEACLPVVETVVFRGDEHVEAFPFASTCSICLSDFAEADVLGKLPCKHVFHADCLDSWLHSGGGAQRGEPGCPFRCGIVTRSSVDSILLDESSTEQAASSNDTSTRAAIRESALANGGDDPTVASQPLSDGNASGVIMHMV